MYVSSTQTGISMIERMKEEIYFRKGLEKVRMMPETYTLRG